ncbi:hypothetical protein TNCV_2925291 [Trichonephila clavipes]|nr:hypothetical protein TNCV_2925291 [Trichonephila clavipes]
MVVQRLTQITPPAATPNQLWQRVEAAWSAVPQEHIHSLLESMPRRVAAKTTNLNGFSKAAITKVFKSWNRNPQSFSKQNFPRAGSASSPTNCKAEQGLNCASTDTNRQARLFPTDFSLNHAQSIAEDRNAYCLKCKNSSTVV